MPDQCEVATDYSLMLGILNEGLQAARNVHFWNDPNGQHKSKHVAILEQLITDRTAEFEQHKQTCAKCKEP